MRLTVRDAARLLEVSEKTVYRWVAGSKLPAFRINGQYRFNRAQLLEWATSNRVNVSPDLFLDYDAEASVPSLAEALRAGGVFHRVTGSVTAAVLRSVVDQMPLPDEVDRGFLLQVLLAREKLASTAIGDGIAIPHVRNPVVMNLAKPMICLSYLEQSVDYGALDGKAVHTLFTIISPTVKAHLGLLSKLSFGLRERGFAAAVRRQAPRNEILSAAERLESSLAARAASAPS